MAEAPALPSLLDGHLVETRETRASVYEDFDANTQVIPGHGPVTDIAAIERVLGYLSAVEREVRAAVAEGLSLEDTVARIELREYRGYTLFGCVHPGSNVPAAYRDLQ